MAQGVQVKVKPAVRPAAVSGALALTPSRVGCRLALGSSTAEGKKMRRVSRAPLRTVLTV